MRVDELRRDVRFALRRLGRMPAFTTIALVSLALGIGANTAIFTLVNDVILRRPAVERPEELVELYFRIPGFSHSSFSYPDFRDMRAATREVFAQIAAMKLSFVQRELGGGVQSLAAELVTGEYFAIRGIEPAAGRLLGAEDDVAAGAHPVVVLSHGFWTRELGGDVSVIGTEMRLSGHPYTVVGVAPASHTGHVRGIEPAFYLPMQMVDLVESGGSQLEQRGSQSLFVTARLAAGASLARAEAVLSAFTEEQKRAYPESWLVDNRVVVVPTAEVIVHPLMDRVLVTAAAVLVVVVMLVLLVACANLASFLLAQGRDRRKEIAIRLALGAGRGGLVRQLLTESVLLAIVGGAAGTLLAWALLRMLVSVPLPFPIPISIDVQPDARVLAFTFGVSLLAGLFFGLVPALASTRADLATTLKDETAGGGPRRRVQLRSMLVVAQVAVSMMLLVTAGLFLRSLLARSDIDPGFGEQPAALLSFVMPAERYPASEGREFVRRMEARLRELPGVTAVGITGNIHLNLINTNWMDVNVDGHAPPSGDPAFQIDQTIVDPGFFEAAGVQLLEGRVFDERVDLADAPPVVVVNRAFAERFWPNGAAIGQIIHTEYGDARVVGVVETVKIRTIGEAPRPFIYRPFTQRYSNSITAVVQTRANAEGLLAAAFTELAALEPDLVFIETRTMERHLSALLVLHRLGAWAIGAVAALALLLAVIGLHGVVSYAVASRTREVGIRMSLGADRQGVVRMMMRGGMRLVALGVLAGLALSFAGASLVRSLLYGVQPFDPITFFGVPVLLIAISVFAAWLPARRASRIDPVRALR